MLADQMWDMRVTEESRITSRFWPKQLEECGCHSLRWFRGRDDCQELSFRMLSLRCYQIVKWRLSNRHLDVWSGFSTVVWVGDINLGIFNIEVAWMAVGHIELTQGVKVDRKEKSKAWALWHVNIYQPGWSDEEEPAKEIAKEHQKVGRWTVENPVRAVF